MISPDTPTTTWLNVPNQLTITRLLLAVVMFVFLSLHMYVTGMVFFLLAAATDYVDGWWARKYSQVTQLGRILDPFADKTVVCGAFIYLAATPGSLLAAWMAVVVVVRELLVTALRSFIEERGGDFSAQWAGKWKMALQCLAIVLCLWRLNYLATAGEVTDSAPPDWLTYTVMASIWGAIALTLYSGIEYIFAAVRMLRQ